MTYQSPSWRRSLALNSSAGSTSASAAAAASGVAAASSSASATPRRPRQRPRRLVSVGLGRVYGVVGVGFGRSGLSLGLFPGFRRGVLALSSSVSGYLELLLRHLVSCFLIA